MFRYCRPHLFQTLGNILKMSLRGPIRMGLSHTPERFAAGGIRPKSNYPNLFVGGTDLTVDTFSGGIVGSWLTANAVLGYDYLDLGILDKTLTSDLEQFMEEPEGDGEEAVLYTPTVIEPLVKEMEEEEHEAAAEASKES